MAKLTLSDLANLQNESTAVSTINANSALIETALENTLSRDGSSPNTMGASLDMNSHSIINLPEPVLDTEPVRLGDIDDLVADAVAAAVATGLQGEPGRSTYLMPEDYGAVGDGVTDDTAAFTSLATALRTAVSGTVEFAPNKTYKVYPTVSGSQNLMDLSTCKSVTINFNGSKFILPAVYTSETTRIFLLQTCYDITINDYWAEQTGSLAASMSAGLQGIYIFNTCQRIRVNNAYQKYGRAIVEVTRGSDLALVDRAASITVDNLHADNVFYPINFEKNGDNVTVRNMRAINSGRCYYASNVWNHDIQVDSIPGSNTLNDVELACNTSHLEAASSNVIRNIKVRYSSRAQTNSSAFASYVAFACQQGTGTTTAGSMRDIDLSLDINTTSSTTESIALDFYKTDSSSADDTTTRGWILENIVVSGLLSNYTNNVNLIRFGTHGTWSGETVSNVVFRDLVTKGSGSGAILVDATGLGKMVFRDVLSQHALTVTNDTVGTVSRLDNVTFSGVTSLGTAAKPAWFPNHDTDTGFSFPASNTIVASSGGSEVWRAVSGRFLVNTLSTIGRVTIDNASSTDYALAITGGASTNTTCLFLETTSNSSNPTVIFKDSSAGQTRVAAFNYVDTSGTAVGQAAYFYNGTGASQRYRILVNGSERFNIDGSGNVIVNTAAIATSATDGFLYIASCAGTPSGVPTSYTGRVPMVYDSTNNKIYVYNGAWKGSAALT